MSEQLPDKLVYDRLSEQLLTWALYSTLSDEAKYEFKALAEHASKLEQTIATQAAEIERMEKVIAYLEQRDGGEETYDDWLAALEGSD